MAVSLINSLLFSFGDVFMAISFNAKSKKDLKMPGKLHKVSIKKLSIF
jgi:hypothetical protein